MLDIKFVIGNIEAVKQNTRDRFAPGDVDKVVSLYTGLKRARQGLEDAQRRSNEIADKFNSVDQPTRDELRRESASLKSAIVAFKKEVDRLEPEYHRELSLLPNMTHECVPLGADENSNLLVRSVGSPIRFDFPARTHIEIGSQLDLIDFEAGTKVAGPKFYYLKNEGVLLEWGLVRMALDLASRHGYMLMTTPELAKDEIIAGSGYSPRGPASQIYSIDGSDLSLIGTSEITIGGYLARSVVSGETLPIKISGVSHCFRTEAGSPGKENKGLYRVHQFSKVELYQFVHPDQSETALEDMLKIEEEFYQALKIPYRVLLMCKGELGAPAFKKYDIEAWMPFLGEGGGYGEVTSASNCTDFQSRRLGIRFKDQVTGRTGFVHTLNGTAVAVTRTMLAILENYQQADGSVSIPRSLQPYVGMDRIRPKHNR